MVVALSTLRHLIGMLFLRVLGPFTTASAVRLFSLSSSLYRVVILGWVIITLTEGYWGTISLIVVWQLFAGIAVAGIILVSVCLLV